MTEFSFSHDADQQRYLAQAGEQFAGEINYRLLEPDVIAFDHTGTEPDFRGQGLAAQLTTFALADVRKRGLKLVPNCSYTANFVSEHPEYQDLLA